MQFKIMSSSNLINSLTKHYFLQNISIDNPERKKFRLSLIALRAPKKVILKNNIYILNKNHNCQEICLLRKFH